MTDPLKAIGSLDDLRGELNRLVSHLGWEADTMTESWELLGNAGGQRADHAALLLARLRPHLDGIAGFCQRVSQQLTGMVADPFERNT